MMMRMGLFCVSIVTLITDAYFRNLTLSLQPGCKHESLLLLWEHECYWTYGRRMVSDIDFGRFRQTLTRAIEKNFANQDHVGSRKCSPSDFTVITKLMIIMYAAASIWF